MLAEVRELSLFHLIMELHRHGLNLGSASSQILLECEQSCVWPCGNGVIVLVKPVIVSPASYSPQLDPPGFSGDLTSPSATATL